MTGPGSPTVALTTLGCKVNQSETDQIARQFAAAGYRCVSFDQPADVYVINTCTVTHVADKKSRQMLHQAHRLNPEALVVAAGCYASIAAEALADDRTLVVRNRDKDRLLSLVDGRLNSSLPESPSFTDQEKYVDSPSNQTRSRAMVKAQDGCDSHCTYCIIPRARGRSRSLHPDEVIRRIHALVGEGHSEIVLTGVDLGSYGGDVDAYPDLGGLLQRILDRSDAQRIRVSSLEPGDFDPTWLSLWKDSRLCRHLHVPLQSGSASVLRRMERTYSPTQFEEMVENCRGEIPGVTVTTDVMVGFPGETEAEFDEGYRFIRRIRFDGMHVFKYSRRSGTRAAHLPDQVPEGVKSERSRHLRAEAAAGVESLTERHRGVVAWVVWEGEHDGIRRGLTDTNVRVYSTATMFSGGLARAELRGPFREGLWAERVQFVIPLVSVS